MLKSALKACTDPRSFFTADINVRGGARCSRPGWIDEAKMKKYCFPPAEDTAIFVCGLPVMYDLWCGPRTEAEVAEGTLLPGAGERDGRDAQGVF